MNSKERDNALSSIGSNSMSCTDNYIQLKYASDEEVQTACTALSRESKIKTLTLTDMYSLPYCRHCPAYNNARQDLI
jgi:hypothetical protein